MGFGYDTGRFHRPELVGDALLICSERRRPRRKGCDHAWIATQGIMGGHEPEPGDGNRLAKAGLTKAGLTKAGLVKAGLVNAERARVELLNEGGDEERIA